MKKRYVVEVNMLVIAQLVNLLTIVRIVEMLIEHTAKSLNRVYYKL